jgi:uncharacterized repeat protein (TIGR03837 family)
MRADIFCHVVDNYGDIGVCWRLARRMAHGHGWEVRLWVDELAPFACLEPNVNAALDRQTLLGIEIIRWHATPDPALEPRDVVIEAFACTPPRSFLEKMRHIRPVWVNLEYLSAEDWIEGCHGLASLRADGLARYFFFPGFTPDTGGVLCEPALLKERDAMSVSRASQEAFLTKLGLNSDTLSFWRNGARVVTLFCYPHAPTAALAQALANDTHTTLLLLPPGIAVGLEATARSSSTLRIARIPFIAQVDFDRLLWCSDLNIIRGEDSFVRALWAAKPLIWHIYPQEADVHLHKLNAWLARYCAPDAVDALIRAWNAPVDANPEVEATFAAALAPRTWSDWNATAQTWAANQSTDADLGDKLAKFCAEVQQKGKMNT